MFTDINRIAELAKEDPKRQFSSIAHLITVAKLYEAFPPFRSGPASNNDTLSMEGSERVSYVLREI
jgi:hypothetical protein